MSELTRQIFGPDVIVGVWANFLTAILSSFAFYLIYLFANKRKLYKLLGLDKNKNLIVYFSNTYIDKSVNRLGQHDLYKGSAIPENEFLASKDILDLLILIGEKDNLILRFIKFLSVRKVNVEFALHLPNDIDADNANLITIGGPAYNTATAYFQNMSKSKLLFDAKGIINRKNKNKILATPSLLYDYGILEKIIVDNKVFIEAAGFHINGTRGSVSYLIKNWNKLPNGEFALLIKFPHTLQDNSGYLKPLKVVEI